jgi:NADH:ubiquinone oxidoreductase subunit
MLSSKAVLAIRSWFFGIKIGEDEFGNVYYESKRLIDSFGRAKRWVKIKGHVDASKVPAHWHGWLHYTMQSPAEKSTYNWSKTHLPNLTGTPFAYHPQNSTKTSLKTTKPNTSYDAWKP